MKDEKKEIEQWEIETRNNVKKSFVCTVLCVASTGLLYGINFFEIMSGELGFGNVLFITLAVIQFGVIRYGILPNLCEAGLRLFVSSEMARINRVQTPEELEGIRNKAIKSLRFWHLEKIGPERAKYLVDETVKLSQIIYEEFGEKKVKGD